MLTTNDNRHGDRRHHTPARQPVSMARSLGREDIVTAGADLFPDTTCDPNDGMILYWPGPTCDCGFKPSVR